MPSRNTVELLYIQPFGYFRFILITFVVCLINGEAVRRDLECKIYALSEILWPATTKCYTQYIDFSDKFQTENHFFPGCASGKSGISTFQIESASRVDFIPLEIVSEFPKLNGLIIDFCTMPVVKSGLLKSEFKKIKYLDLKKNEIKTIEPTAFQHLTKLIWIRLYNNNIKTLSYKLFSNNPKLRYIDLSGNQINSIHPNFFDGLNKIILIGFGGNRCSQEDIGCEDCRVSQSEITSALTKCYDNCLADSDCN